MIKRHEAIKRTAIASALLAIGYPACAVTVTDNFTSGKSEQPWILPSTVDGSTNAACLTAGTTANSTGSSVPPCSTNGIDTVGNGALRLTPATNYSHGSIVSSAPFPGTDGIDVTFTTYTYGGNGADGISFYLIDADIAKAASQAGVIPTAAKGSVSNTVGATMGATGGSLGYSCSNGNAYADGVVGAYLGLGIDEYGNFLNAPDNTSSGNGFTAGRIGLRGAGNITYDSLQQRYGNTNYPNGLSLQNQQDGVRATCASGKVQQWNAWWGWSPTTTTIQQNYTMLRTSSGTAAAVTLPSNQPLWTSNTSRSNATPIVYQLKITSTGKLSFSYSYKGGVYTPVISNQDITAANGALPSNLLFGFAGSTGGSNNIHEITCFKAAPATTSSDSATLNLPTGQYKTGAQVFIGSYNPSNWAGQLTANELLYNTTTNAITWATVPNWDASCTLTGGACASTGASGITAQATRNILTWNGIQGVPFTWATTTSGTTLTSNQQTALSDDSFFLTNGQDRLNYLRGNRGKEQSSGGPFRTRTSILGDIINSSPTWVGPPMAPYPGSSISVNTAWKDNLYPSKTPAENASASTNYGAFQTSRATRQNVVYVGSNDGLLHGFRAGYYDASGNYVKNSTTVPNDGYESLSYIPAAVVSKIHSNTNYGLDYSSPNYGHAYQIDATPGTADLFYGGSWKTWLVGGLGHGGQAIYALDITDPTQFSEAQAASLVKGEWSYSSASTSIWNNLGKTYGTPQIRRFHNGQWGAVFGNGWCFTTANSPATSNDTTCQASATGYAGIYVMLLKSDGTSEFRFLSTSKGSTAKPNGIAYVTPADLDEDHIVDYVYAGDLLGNVWRFDLTSDNPDSWSVSSTTPVFSTPSNQPITTQVMVSSSKAYNETTPRIILNFATGVVVPQSLTDSAQYASTTQSVYGVWDWNMANWNGKSSVKYASLASGTAPLGQTNLAQQTFPISGGTRSVATKTVCWQGGNNIAGCTNYNQFGWYANLASQTSGGATVYEQVIYNPTVNFGALIFNTTIPEVNLPQSCTATSASGWTFALDPATGSGQPGFFSGNTSDTAGYALPLNATGSASVLNVNGQPVLITKDKDGKPKGSGGITKIYPGGGGYRINWIQLR